MQSELARDSTRPPIWPGADPEDGIGKSIALGLISFVGDPDAAGPADFFSHHGQRAAGEPALRPCNSRSLCAEALPYLQNLAPRRSQPRVLELGPGAGVAAAEIRHDLPHCRLETISLTPIDPYLWLRPEPGGPGRTPFIDRQFVGDIDPALAALTGSFDFIYDCFGPVFWHLTEAVRQDSRAPAEGLLQAILNRLAPGGVLFVAASEGTHLLEQLLDRLADATDGVVLFPPRFASTNIRICILEKSP